jgi:hypothetical protein
MYKLLQFNLDKNNSDIRLIPNNLIWMKRAQK